MWGITLLNTFRAITALQVALLELEQSDLGDDDAAKAVTTCLKAVEKAVKKALKEADV